MKKYYSEPELNIIGYDFRDVVSASPANDASLAISDGDNGVTLPPDWWD